jgi:hypothetical protein
MMKLRKRLHESTEVARVREMFRGIPPADFARYFSEVLLAATDAQIAAFCTNKAALARVGFQLSQSGAASPFVGTKKL